MCTVVEGLAVEVEVAAVAVAVGYTDHTLEDRKWRVVDLTQAVVVERSHIYHLASGRCSRTWSGHIGMKVASFHLQQLRLELLG